MDPKRLEEDKAIYDRILVLENKRTAVRVISDENELPVLESVGWNEDDEREHRHLLYRYYIEFEDVRRYWKTI